MKLLVFIGAETASTHSGILSEWKTALNREAHFNTVITEVVPDFRATDLGRLAQVLIQMDMIRSIRPDAIQIFGAAAMPCSGYGIPDGHTTSKGCLWGDVPYGFPDFTYTDVQNQVPTAVAAIQLNVPGDGRWDQTYFTNGKLQCPVARVYFGEAPGLATSEFTHRCYTGRPTPPLDEHTEFEKYMRRNLDYRNGLTKINRIVTWTHRPSQDIDRPKYQAEMPWIPWRVLTPEVPPQDLNSRYLFQGTMPASYYDYLGPDCEPMPVLVEVCYRSFAFEVMGLYQGLRRGVGLCRMWSRDKWHFLPTSEMVADDIRHSWKSWLPTGAWAGASVHGDLTLPYEPHPIIATLEAPSDLTIT